MNVGRKCDFMEKTLKTETKFSEPDAQMDLHAKIRILRYITGRADTPGELSETEAVIVAKILARRVIDPNFLPEEITTLL